MEQTEVAEAENKDAKSQCTCVHDHDVHVAISLLGKYSTNPIGNELQGNWVNCLKQLRCRKRLHAMNSAATLLTFPALMT